MNKKTVRKRFFHMKDENPRHESGESILLQDIHEKIGNSAALNGGFDRLLYKIDSIEHGQVKIVEKVDKIHDAIYHPDDGLFARISANKALNSESISKVEKKVIEIDTWKQQVSKDGENCEKESDVLQLKIKEIENSIKNISKFQSTTFSALKWFAAAIGGGLISMMFKAIYSSLH